MNESNAGMTGNDTYSKEIPDHVIQSLAQCILPSIRAYYESEEGQRAFAEWKARSKE